MNIIISIILFLSLLSKSISTSVNRTNNDFILLASNANKTEEIEPKEFCLYNSEGVLKLYDSVYRNAKR